MVAKTITPPKLVFGATIALISPSARLNDIVPHRIERSIKFLRSLGFDVKNIHTPLPPKHTLRDSVQLRVEEIHQAFSDPVVSAIVCNIGGTTCGELLRHLDLDLIRMHPKIFCGFSDITLLHYAFYTRAGLRTFYGPKAITQWAEFPEPLAFTTNHFLDALTNPKPSLNLPSSEAWTEEVLDLLATEDTTRARNLQENPGWRWLRRGKAEGVLFGGCLPSVLQVSGTPYDLDSYKDVILILELSEAQDHTPQPLALVKKQITHLMNMGVLEDISGLIIGRSAQFSKEMDWEYDNYLLAVTEGKDYPMVAGVDIGHTDPILTVPFGVRAKLDGEKEVCETLENCVY